MSVWMCSGQGAQKPGMGTDLLDLPQVADTFTVLSKELGIDVALLAKDGTPEEVNGAVAAQALTMAVSVGVGRVLQDAGIRPDAIIGFSLGQISALVLAGVLSLEDAARLLKVRATAMDAACQKNPGGMVALMGASVEEARALCEAQAQGGVLVPANMNCPGQVVISGTPDALDRASAAWKDAGKKAVKLATAGAFHSPLMADAAQEVETFCASLDFAEPQVTLLCNTDARPFVAAEAAARLGAQVCSGVMFQQSVEALIAQGETDFVEVGFGGVLVNLVKRIDRGTTRAALGTREQLDAYMAEHGA
ncbi:ACP S-malonyltransferase [Adlercreutzia murintestinalis]|uniref:ACP S-malonyltransferase n=1 Tax=Adlercreutzia murintestinalis TaxID=2941325 RepID=UPI00203FE7F4|nr:ACP S-malonyltransferase [Adlercreutzia murintestinalis]